MEASPWGGCKTIERIFPVKARERTDAVLVSAGGYPFDINFYQVMKSIMNTMNMVKDNGVIALVASCIEGLGPEQFREWLNIESPVRLERELRKSFTMIGKITYDMKVGLKGKRVLIITDLSKEEVGLLGFQKIDSLEEAKNVLSWEEEPALYVVPYGNITLAKVD